MKDQSLLIVGAARNCSRSIAADVARIGAAFQSARRLQWFIVESDSADDTAKQLDAMASDISGFRSVSLGHLRSQFPERTIRIAHCRNRYLQELRENPDYADVDYVVVADLDGINDQLTEASALSCFTRSDWDLCSANQRGPYYDIFALRHATWSPNDCLA
jgi:hypothetical protein